MKYTKPLGPAFRYWVKRKNRRYGETIFCFLVLIMFSLCNAVVFTSEAKSMDLSYKPTIVRQKAKSRPTKESKPVSQPYKVIEVSCYTGIESHGANGRNPWSVATYLYKQGTKLYIEGYGDKVVETVTAKKYSYRIDMWFGDKQEDHDRCIQFGIKKLKVYETRPK